MKYSRVGQKQILCPQGALNSESNVNDKATKSLHSLLRSQSVFPLMFNVIIMYRVLAIPTKAYTISSSAYHQKRIPSPQADRRENKMKNRSKLHELGSSLLPPQVRASCHCLGLCFLPFEGRLSLYLSIPGPSIPSPTPLTHCSEIQPFMRMRHVEVKCLWEVFSRGCVYCQTIDIYSARC